MFLWDSHFKHNAYNTENETLAKTSPKQNVHLLLVKPAEGRGAQLTTVDSPVSAAQDSTAGLAGFMRLENTPKDRDMAC